MAQSQDVQGRSMGLKQFESYLRDRNAELDACIREIEEVQQRLQQAFQAELKVWQGLFGYCYPQILAHREALPAEFVSHLDHVEQEELQKLQAEMVELTSKIEAGRKAIDGWTAEAQEAARALRSANPEFDAREEDLKRRISTLQDEYTEAYRQLEAAREPLLGWLSNAGGIRQARHKQEEIKKQQAQATEQLREVRQKWLSAVQETSEKQSQLREQWQQTTVEIAELQARYDYLRNNLKEVARQNGIRRVLDEMTEAPALEGELGDKLRQLAEHNAVRARFEEGLMAVSQSLGLLRGINTGLDKFCESVAQVLAEQSRYNLREIDIDVPRDVVVVNQTWAWLASEARDEDKVLQSPLEFAAIVRQYVNDRLTPQVIQYFFETMGDSLNRATAAWN